MIQQASPQQQSQQLITNGSLQQQQQQQQSQTNSMYVGPYKLEKTLGKGQTGLVKLGIHHKTGKKVAIKIVNREKLNESVLMKVEREITIMKLIEHPHVLKLYDVYENKKYLYLILEHVSGGELFDYLVKKSRLTIKEARKFFKQIISALDFCHSHLICHRDLKPENLLLDDKLNIKIADFGMASLQVDGSMLETSCGSPHYACPEVIRGEKYDGRKADVWSCGVILYALLVGALPFDDDNLKYLLEKIKKGHFQIPPYVPPECQELLRSMIEIDANKRMNLEEVSKHPWVLAGCKEEVELELPVSHVVQTAIIPSLNEIDTDIVAHMTSLGSFKDRTRLVDALLNERHNIEKVIYFLLLERKLKMPANEDEDELVFLRTRLSSDAPKKRVDKFKSPTSGRYSQLSIGSPDVGRRGLILNTQSNSSNGSTGLISNHGHMRHNSCHTTPLQSPCTSPLMPMKLDFNKFHHHHHNHHHHNQVSSSSQSTSHTPTSLNSSMKSIDQQSSGNSSGGTIRSRINSFKNSVFTPKFYRRTKMTTPEKDSMCNVTPSTHHHQPHHNAHAPPSGSTTPDQSRSWFQRWNLNKQDSTSGTSVNSLISNAERDKEFVYTISDRPLNNIKADLIHAFLSTSDLIHNISSPNLFRCEYRSPDKFLSRNVRFKVEIVHDVLLMQQVSAAVAANIYQTYKIHFTLMSGSTKQFLSLCQHIVNLISTNQYASQLRQQRNTLSNKQQTQTAHVPTKTLQTPSPSSSASTSSSSSVSLPLSPIQAPQTSTYSSTSRSRKNSISNQQQSPQIVPQQQQVGSNVASPSITSLQSTQKSTTLSATSIKAALFSSLTNGQYAKVKQAASTSTDVTNNTTQSSTSSTSLFSSSLLDFF